MSKPELLPCSHCRRENPKFEKRSGYAGYTRTPYYHETIQCRKCNIVLSARTPLVAVKMWNRASSAMGLKLAEKEVSESA